MAAEHLLVQVKSRQAAPQQPTALVDALHCRFKLAGQGYRLFI